MSDKPENKSDPFYQREAQNYKKPIPSREYILQCLSSAGGPLKFKAIQNKLGLFDIEDEVALSRRLAAMERDGQIIKDRKSAYGLPDKMDLIKGTIEGHRDGYGFFIPDSSKHKTKDKKDWFISAREMRKVFPGERVLVREKTQHRDGRIEASIVEVLVSDEPIQLVGRFYQENGINFVVPEDTRISQDILIPPDDPMNVEPEQVVIVRINIRPTYRSKAVGTVVQVLGDYLAPGMEIQIAIAQYGIRQHWSDDIYDQLKQLPLEVEESECQGRKDLRELPLITIDGEDARDFDDAVYCQPNDKGWQLWVAIADVSHYVTEDSPLDIEAKQRGTSVYFPESVIPMLPEQVSNGLCSLKPHVDRLCMVCEMQLDKTGKVTSSQFYPAVMHSKARMTYTKVWAILQGDEVLRSEYQTLVEPIENLHSIYKLRDKLRQQRGAIDFDTTETQFIFNENKKIETIVPVHRNDAHKLIEECMICTNVAAAEYLVKHKAPGLFRVHMGPQDSKLEKFRSFIAELGLFITGGDAPEPAVFQKLLNEVKDRPDFENIQIMLLRSMSQAEYTPENQGHFGLAFEAYSHFTSPIRRYPDLIVHRIIKSIITGANKDKSYPYNNQVLSQIGQSSSHSERNADLATRDVSDWLKCEYMQAHIGKAYLGTVSGVTNFGVFVRLDTVFVEGLIHVTELGNDYYHFDAGKQRLIGERNRQSFGIGDQLEIEVVDVDIEQRRIDFSLRAVISSKGKPVKKMSEREKLYEQAKKKVARDKLKETGKKPKKSGKRSKAVSSSKKSKKTRKKR